MRNHEHHSQKNLATYLFDGDEEFWAVIKADPQAFKLSLMMLMENIGPLAMEGSNGQWHGELDKERAEWFLDIDAANARRMGRAALGVALTDPDKEAHLPYAVPEKVTYFAGNPPRSAYVRRRLIDRLEYAFACVSANNQEGGMGTTYDEKDVAKRHQEIRLVIEDLAYALLGPEKAATFINFDAEPLGDVDYQRELSVCAELRGSTVDDLVKDLENQDE